MEKILISTAYEIRVPSDERSSSVFGYFSNSVDGLAASRGKGWYGADGSVNKQVEVVSITMNNEVYSFKMEDRITVNTSMEHYKENKLAKERQAALAKLSVHERKILGLE